MYYNSLDTSKVRNVAIYARVSTEHEAQLAALENQKDWYKPILAQNPNWNIVRMYVDEGITGTSAKKRPQFMQMIEDADGKEFDLILTREVSRFARNTVDTLQYTRLLKSKGVEVFFISDNIRTFDGDGELRLTIMATLAQDESRKTSMRVKCGQKTSMENGVLYGNGNILGYDRVGDELVINPEQAETVRMIYDMYLSGLGMRAIQFKLEQSGRLTSMGKSNWYCSNISKILKNSFYCGIITYRKEYVSDYLEQKRLKNFGDIEQIKVRGKHKPIVTEEEFEQVQKMLGSRTSKMSNLNIGQRRMSGRKVSTNVWTDILMCECGHKFNRKKWHTTKDGESQFAYQCYDSLRTGSVATRIKKGLPTDGICESPMIPEWKLQMMAKFIFEEYITNTDEIVKLAESMIEAHINDGKVKTDNSDTIKKNRALISKLSDRLNSLIEMRADGEISKEMFQSKKLEIEENIATLSEEIIKLQEDSAPKDEATQFEKIQAISEFLRQSVNPDANDNIPDQVIKAFVKKVVVHKDGYDWYLRFDYDDPIPASVDGTRKNNARISPFCYSPHRQLSTNEGVSQKLASKISNSSFVKVQELAIDFDYAKAFLYSFSKKRRVQRWENLQISVYL